MLFKQNINIKQRDITDCGAACIASVAAFYKLKIPVSRIRQYAGTDKKGTNVLGLIEAAELLGFQAKGVKGTIESLSKVPLPSIAHVLVDEKLAHYVVIYKVVKNFIYIMDPANGSVNKLSVDEFKKVWTGVLILLLPSESFVTGNNITTNQTRFWQLIQPHKSIMAEAIFGALVYTILGLATSIYIQKIVDFVLVGCRCDDRCIVVMVAVLL
jgi:ATP-binding cassette subfamily B protein